MAEMDFIYFTVFDFTFLIFTWWIMYSLIADISWRIDGHDFLS